MCLIFIQLDSIEEVCYDKFILGKLSAVSFIQLKTWTMKLDTYNFCEHTKKKRKKHIKEELRLRKLGMNAKDVTSVWISSKNLDFHAFWLEK